MLFNIGNTIKVIRENKGLTQSYVCGEIITQGNYSKYEKSLIDISTTTFESILNRLEISMEELIFIGNNYEYTQRQYIVHRFYNLIYNNETILHHFIEEIDEYLINNSDIFISNIKQACSGLLILMRTNDIEMARQEVEDIWTGLSKRDHLYISDIYLINSILFLFPLDTSRDIKNYLFRCIDRYKEFQRIERLKINLSVNFSILLIRNNLFTEALEEIEYIAKLSKNYSDYLSIAICNIRKGICLNNIHKNLSKGSLYINKGLNLLEAMEEIKILDIFKAEIERYNYK